METPALSALSLQNVLRRQLDVVANNLANANTPGYKFQQLLAMEKEVEADGSHVQGYRPLHMVLDYGTFRDFSDGTLQATGNDLDIALVGRGFLKIGDPENPRYTRAGNLHLNTDRELVTLRGDRVLDDGDRPIQLGIDDTRITVSENGTISSENGVLARLNLVDFDNLQQLRAIGEGLYEAPPEMEERQAADIRVEQGMIEGSNVSAITEISQMIEIQRRYESAGRLISSQNEKSVDAIKILGQPA